MPEPWLRPGAVTDAVADWTGIERKRILSDERTRRVSKARALLAHCLRQGCEMSWNEIAAWVNRDYTSVISLTRDHDANEVDAVLQTVRRAA